MVAHIKPDLETALYRFQMYIYVYTQEKSSAYSTVPELCG